MERGSGILLHISSLPSNFGIGDLGPSAYKFVDFLHETKQKYWQVLPLNPTDPMFGNSPYSSHSAFAGNPLFISPALLKEEGLLQDKEFRTKTTFEEDKVLYEDVASFKSNLLKTAYRRFKASSKYKVAFDDFCNTQGYWLDDYANYIILKKLYKNKPWNKWPEDILQRNSQALEKLRKDNQEPFDVIRFEQFIFFQQWFKLKQYCTQKGIKIIGDIPIYVSWDSVDVWTRPHLYKLKDDGRPEFVAGVPPDYFSATGQRWGNPVYKWPQMKENKFKWWHERINHNLNCFDIVRIDHFRGLVAYWEIPAKEKTAVNGQWVRVPVDDFLQSLQQKFSELPIIAEDLGIITDDVKEAMKRFQLPGMKVLLFAFNGDMNTHPYLPHNYDENYVVYTGTHDNNTTLGWFEKEATDQEKKNFFNYIKKIVQSEDVPFEMITLALESRAKLSIIPMQDLLGLKAKHRMNTPSTTNGNWLWRMNMNYSSGKLIKEFTQLVKDTDRA